MLTVNRREFLKHSIVATGALATAPMLVRIPPSPGEQPATRITRTLGRTGMKIPIVSMGVMRADNPALVRAALKAGIVYLDTAHGYQKGKNEEMLGELLKEYPRDSFIISTKVPPEESQEAFLEKLDISLKRLRMDHVDILYLHGPSSREATLDPVMLGALQEAKKSGKARFVGVSTHKNEPEVILAAAESKVHDVVLTSINFKQDHADQMKEAIAKAAEAGIGIVAMKTMAGGFFDRDKAKPVNCRAALKWVLQNPNVTTAIPGMTTFDQLADNAAVNQDLAFTEEERKALVQGEAQGGLYCNACERCVPGCSKNLPIPELMRAYMYAYGYGSPALGRELVTINGLQPNPCADCRTCTADCVKGFDLREKIADVSRLAAVPEEFLA